MPAPSLQTSSWGHDGLLGPQKAQGEKTERHFSHKFVFHTCIQQCQDEFTNESMAVRSNSYSQKRCSRYTYYGLDFQNIISLGISYVGEELLRWQRCYFAFNTLRGTLRSKSCPGNLAFLQQYSSHPHTNENNNKVTPNQSNVFFLQYRLGENNHHNNKKHKHKTNKQNNSQRDILPKSTDLVSVTQSDDRSQKQLSNKIRFNT